MRRSSLRFSFHVVVRARMIRGLVASIHGGPSGADRGAAKRAPEAWPPLPATLRLDRHRGPGRKPMAKDSQDDPRPGTWAIRPVFRIPVPGPFSDNTWQGAGFSGQWRRNRTFDSQILDLMLYPTELSVVQMKGIEPPTSGPKSGALPLSYIRDPNPQSGAVCRAAKPPARAETKAPTVVLTSVLVTGSAPIAPATGCRKRHCHGEFAATFNGGISATPLPAPAIARSVPRR